MARKVFEDLYYSRSKYYDPTIYILVDEESRVLLIDPGSGDFHEHPEHELWDVGLRKKDVVAIILTHKHYNHYAAARKFPWATIYAHEIDAEAIESGDESTLYRVFSASPVRVPVNVKIKDTLTLKFGRFELEIFHCPGHTRGSLCIYEKNLKILFSGDTVFCNGNISRTDLIEDKDSYLKTLNKLLELDIAKLFPGHGEPCDGNKFKELLRKKLELYKELKIL